MYAIGGNEEAARLSGVNVRLHKTLVYGVSGPGERASRRCCSPRGSIRRSRSPASMYELDAIAATVIGGTSLMGGEGGLGGTLIGALIMGVLRNGLNLLGVSSFLQQVVIGARHRRCGADRHGAQDAEARAMSTVGLGRH